MYMYSIPWQRRDTTTITLPSATCILCVYVLELDTELKTVQRSLLAVQAILLMKLRLKSAVISWIFSAVSYLMPSIRSLQECMNHTQTERPAHGYILFSAHKHCHQVSLCSKTSKNGQWRILY